MISSENFSTNSAYCGLLIHPDMFAQTDVDLSALQTLPLHCSALICGLKFSKCSARIVPSTPRQCSRQHYDAAADLTLVESGEAKQQSPRVPAFDSEAIKSNRFDPVVCRSRLSLL
jgi:hypothetical protein